ncbi:universal stress protein [Lichenifustis flavocetrariae]|uniref:Universal stress protein n=1 Tax=Lichenifustis flavocetrariae TaxID=2949735 RepID=A0AA42CLH6_9HYPH|nr:universal stress protein [Lichenifustis flavocetrariae]MCW6510411.1 universal stress protein [Lichenifustis flavocetrariae]
MPYRNVLVPVEEHSRIASVLATAVLIGRVFESYLQGVPLAPDISDIVIADISIGATVFDARAREVLSDRALKQFQGAMALHDVPHYVPGSHDFSHMWLPTMMSDSALGPYARIFDMIVVGKPGSNNLDPRQATFESVLFESGRPVLIAPDKVPPTLGDTILIAWNRSSETARTLHFALPLLRRAKRIVIQTMDIYSVPGPSGDQLAQALARDGIMAETVTITGKTDNEGPSILAKAAEIGADLVIKGGYTQSRLRQMIFGGATSHVLAHSELPVFMAH